MGTRKGQRPPPAFPAGGGGPPRAGQQPGRGAGGLRGGGRPQPAPLTSPCIGPSAWPRCGTTGRPPPHTWGTRPWAQGSRWRRGTTQAGETPPPNPQGDFFVPPETSLLLSFHKGQNFEIYYKEGFFNSVKAIARTGQAHPHLAVNQRCVWGKMNRVRYLLHPPRGGALPSALAHIYLGPSGNPIRRVALLKITGPLGLMNAQSSQPRAHPRSYEQPQ